MSLHKKTTRRKTRISQIQKWGLTIAKVGSAILSLAAKAKGIFNK